MVMVTVMAAGGLLAACSDSGMTGGIDAAAGGSGGASAGSSRGGASGDGAGGGGAGGSGGVAGFSGGGAGGSGGAAGFSGGGAGGSGGGVGPARVFEVSAGIAPTMPVPTPCAADGACPDEQICFRLAAELAVCDVAQLPVRTTCSFTTDECDCTGRTCAAGLVCVMLQESAHSYNTCLQPPCASPSDCTGGSVCTPTSLIVRNPGRCFMPACRSDADCSGGVDGRCALVVEFNGGPLLERVGCVFAGLPADATACAPDQATQVRVRGSIQPYHTCAGR
jgi:hypothetical protein